MTNLDFKSDKEFFNKLFHIALPVAFQSLMLASVAAADALMLGHIEQNAMSAVSLATQIQFVQNMFIFSVTMAESILGAQYWGKQDKVSLNKLFHISLKLNIGISIIFFIGCLVFPQYLMMIFTDQKELIEIGAKYLNIAGWSYLISGISQCYLTMMKVSDHPGRTATISSCTVVINIVLNAVFIFGLFGVPKMEAEGAAVATLISRIVEVVWAVGISYKKDYIHPQIKYTFVHDRLLFGDFMKCMWPLLGAGLFWGIGFTSYSAFMGHLGADATAANSVTAVVRELLCCFCNGISAAAGIMIGNELGAGNLDKGKLYGQRLLVISFWCGAIITVAMLALTPVVSHFVILTEGANKYLFQMMLVTSFYMFGRCVNGIAINGIFDCGGDTMFDVYSLAACMWGLAIPLAFLGTFIFHWPVIIVYACTCIDEVGKIPWMLVHFKKYKWVKDLTR